MIPGTRRRRLGTVTALALVLSALLPQATVAAAGGSAATPQDVSQAVSFRSRLGLRSERAFVEGTFGNRAYTKAAWGVPLDAAEAREIDRRASFQKASGAALRSAANDADSAGAYFDHGAGGALVFLTAGDPARARAKVRGDLPPQATARFERVGRSMRALEALQERVNVDLRAGGLAALGVTSTSIDPRANAVVVGAAAATEELRIALTNRYGEGLVLVTELPGQGGDAGCTARDSCPPAKGGIEIDSTYNGNNCTTGLLVRVAGSNAVRILTAGHCVGLTGGTGTSRKWRHAGADLGWSEFAVWTNGADADVGLLAPSTAVTGDRNLVFSASSSNVVGLRDWKRTAEQVPGTLLCRAGATSGHVCGTITLTNRTKDVDGRSIDHQWVVDFDACPGDSGAPYLAGDIAFGIHSDSTVGCEPNTNQGWYSPMGYVWDVLAAHGHPVAMCTEATCGSHVNAWTQRGPLDAAIGASRLVKLADGRVLAVGSDVGDDGSGGGAAGRSPEVYDRGTGAWTEVAPAPWLPTICDGQYATRLGDGRVLVGGGVSDGGGSDPCSAAAYLFDPDDGEDGAWTTAEAPPVPIAAAGAVPLNDGRAFVAGRGGDGGTVPVALAYDPSNGEWATLAAPPDPGPGSLVARLADGRVLLSGDVASSFYNPGTNAWAGTNDVGGNGAAALLLSDGRMIVAGGRTGSGGGTTLRTGASIFNPGTGAWTQLAALRAGRADFSLVQLSNGQVLAAGGLLASSGTPAGALSRSADILDWGTGAWHAAPSLLVARAGHGAVVLDGGSVLAAGGGTDASETFVGGDVLPPVAGAPSTRLRSGVTLGTSTVPVHVSWSATDTGGSGVGTYDVARSTDGGAFTTIASTLTSAGYDTTLTTGHTYRFQVRARDWAGNLGPWRAATTVFSASITQQSSSSVTWSGSWTTSSYSSYSGGTTRYSKSAGASSSYTFSARGIAFVTARGPARGSARIYVDGTLKATVSLYSASKSYRQVLYQQLWSTTGQHTIRIVVVGTSGHPRVDVDAFVLLKAQ